MNNGAFGENFPYSNFHDLNMDWIIKIAKDFLDQYTNLQEMITSGEESLQNLTESGLEQLTSKADELEELLQDWYNTHSEDIADQLASALSDLNAWYTEHQNYLNNTLLYNIALFDQHAETKAAETLESIPADYSTLAEKVRAIDDNKLAIIPNTKNKLNCNTAQTQTINGVIFTPHFTRDFLDYIDVYGTASGNADYEIEGSLEAGDYILSSFLDWNGNPSVSTGVLTVYFGTGMEVIVASDAPRAGTVTQDGTAKIRIRVLSGNSADHVKVYPMVRTSDDSNTKYVPYNYYNSVQQDIIELYSSITKINNLLDLRISNKNQLNCNMAPVATISGVTFTPHFTRGFLDYINVNGTAEGGNADYEIETLLPTGNFILSSFIDGNGDAVDATNVLTIYFGPGMEVIVPADAPRTGSTSNSGNAKLRIRVLSGNTADNIKVYPMVRYNGVTDPAYVPYGYRKSVQSDLDDIYAEIEELQSYRNSHNILYGKTLVTAGDSITFGTDIDEDGLGQIPPIEMYLNDSDGNFSRVTGLYRKVYGYQIAERNNMVFYNAGVSGSTMQGEGGTNGFSLANGRYTKLPSHIDYITLWFGWNDKAIGTLGTINDQTNATFYGAYNIVIPYIQTNYPYAKLGLIVPYGTDEAHRNAIRELGNKWGVAVWDNYKGGTPLYYGKEDNVGVIESAVLANRAKYQANGAHPNYEGQKELSHMIEAWLRSI